MSAILSPAIYLSIDSLVAAFGLAPFLRNRAERYRLAACFGLCDMLGTAAGAVEPVRAVIPALAPHAAAIGLICAALVIIFRSNWCRWPMILALPVLLSIDNLTTPLPPETPCLTGAALAGLTSATLAFVGTRLGALSLRPAIPGCRALAAPSRGHGDGDAAAYHLAAYPLLASLVLILS
jgi:hypothetical protein